ncbi:MAG: adenosylmethionine decarboxylase [Pirellula sp.]|jgi:S-adenosylmethionine decarboxylase|nr:adenosylmethionine decarboxylase [Pirellula sp.]
MNNPVNGPVHVPLGWHWLVDLSDCGLMPKTLHEVEEILTDAANISGATIVQKCFHAFSPHGLSGVIVIAESHIAIHTWPEHRAIAVDFFSCSQKLNVEAAIDHIRKAFGAIGCNIRKIERSSCMQKEMIFPPQ